MNFSHKCCPQVAKKSIIIIIIIITRSRQLDRMLIAGFMFSKTNSNPLCCNNNDGNQWEKRPDSHARRDWFHGNQPNCCQDISVWTKVMDCLADRQAIPRAAPLAWLIKIIAKLKHVSHRARLKTQREFTASPTPQPHNRAWRQKVYKDKLLGQDKQSSSCLTWTYFIQ